jgi:hypothetical protein
MLLKLYVVFAGIILPLLFFAAGTFSEEFSIYIPSGYSWLLLFTPISSLLFLSPKTLSSQLLLNAILNGIAISVNFFYTLVALRIVTGIIIPFSILLIFLPLCFLLIYYLSVTVLTKKLSKTIVSWRPIIRIVIIRLSLISIIISLLLSFSYAANMTAMGDPTSTQTAILLSAFFIPMALSLILIVSIPLMALSTCFIILEKSLRGKLLIDSTIAAIFFGLLLIMIQEWRVTICAGAMENLQSREPEQREEGIKTLQKYSTEELFMDLLSGVRIPLFYLLSHQWQVDDLSEYSVYPIPYDDEVPPPDWDNSWIAVYSKIFNKPAPSEDEFFFQDWRESRLRLRFFGTGATFF